ncbi:hypothetical protein LAZ67_5003881 [Cordylochernes scorpioides]|uniref:Uncharacterized protein n=1 Tax=Cordylochernes scorpioides TaxID=51811 RepID=A0ABY6KHL1_9ARAC|nr:hypothetical protein LAZ67_5003881 [Cordylochernes scorpioides]
MYRNSNVVKRRGPGLIVVMTSQKVYQGSKFIEDFRYSTVTVCCVNGMSTKGLNILKWPYECYTRQRGQTTNY